VIETFGYVRRHAGAVVVTNSAQRQSGERPLARESTNHCRRD
jgi:hypothetical protein